MCAVAAGHLRRRRPSFSRVQVGHDSLRFSALSCSKSMLYTCLRLRSDNHCMQQLLTIQGHCSKRIAAQCGHKGLGSKAVLHIASVAAPLHCKFVAVSHCWSLARRWQALPLGLACMRFAAQEHAWLTCTLRVSLFKPPCVVAGDGGGGYGPPSGGGDDSGGGGYWPGPSGDDSGGGGYWPGPSGGDDSGSGGYWPGPSGDSAQGGDSYWPSGGDDGKDRVSTWSSAES